MTVFDEYVRDGATQTSRGTTASTTAPIVAGVLNSYYITTPINITLAHDPRNRDTTVEFWAKPAAPGVVANLFGYTIEYTGNSYKFTALSGDNAEVATPHNAARHIAVTITPALVSFAVDGEFVEIDNEVFEPVAPFTVAILPNGGIIDGIAIYDRALGRNAIMRHFSVGRQIPQFSVDSIVKMTDDERINEVKVNLLSAPIEGEQYVDLEFTPLPDAIAFKFEWTHTGSVSVMFDGLSVSSGVVMATAPQEISIVVNGRLTDFMVTMYPEAAVMGESQEGTVTTIGATSSTDTHPLLHDDQAAASGPVTITPHSTIRTISFWTNRRDGTIMPGLSVANGVLTGASFVNGAVPSGAVRDWYMISVTGTFTSPVTIQGPVANISMSEDTLTAAQVARLYESYFKNPSVVIPADPIGVTLDEVFSIQKAWAVVSGA